MNHLARYLEFLPDEQQIIIERIRKESRDPVSIISGIHWVPHSIIMINSVAALTLSPDRCYDECFADWSDYSKIKSMTPLMELKLGRPIFLRRPPSANIVRPKLWKRLQEDAYYKKMRKK